MDRCVGDLCSDHHGDGSLPPKAPWRGWRVGGGGRGAAMEQVANQAATKMQSDKDNGEDDKKHLSFVTWQRFQPS